MIDPIFKDVVVYSSLLILLSIGLTLSYLTTKVPNFAHGSFATMGAYLSLISVKMFKSNPYSAMPFAFIISGLLAFGLYYLVLKPLIKKNASHLIQMVATLAYDLILIAIINILSDSLSRTYKITSREFTLRSYDLVVSDLSLVVIIAPLCAIIIISSLWFTLTKTKFGIAMRATIENPNLSSVLGINTGLVYGISWFLSVGLAGIAGVIMSIWFLGDADLGPQLLPSIFAASIAGGLGSIFGAAIGGLLIGVTEVFGTRILAGTIGTWIISYRPAIPLLFIIITLLISPRGLLDINLRKIRKKSKKQSTEEK